MVRSVSLCVWSLGPEGVKLPRNSWLIVVSQGQDILPANWEKGGEFFWPVSEDTHLKSWKHNLLIIPKDSCSETFKHLEVFPHKEACSISPKCLPLPFEMWQRPCGHSSLLRHHICPVVPTISLVVLKWSPMRRNTKCASETALQVEEAGLAFY